MIGAKITRTVYDSKRAGEIMQALITAGFTKVTYEEHDGSTIGQKDIITITANTINWKVLDNE